MPLAFATLVVTMGSTRSVLLLGGLVVTSVGLGTIAASMVVAFRHPHAK